MEMAIDREDFDFEIFEDDNFTPAKKNKTAVSAVQLWSDRQN